MLLHSLRLQKTLLQQIPGSLGQITTYILVFYRMLLTYTYAHLPIEFCVTYKTHTTHTNQKQDKGKMSSISAKLLWVAVRDRLASLLAFIVTGVKIVPGTAMACFLVIILVVVFWAFYITSGIDFDQVGFIYIFRLLHPYLDSCCLLGKFANTSGVGVYSWKSLRIIISCLCSRILGRMRREG